MNFPNQEWICNKANEFMRGPDNELHMPAGAEPAFAEPLLGYAAGDDPVWRQLKVHAGPGHWTPEEAYALAFPDAPAPAAELTVLSWILPQTPATRADNRKESVYPAERWARARIMGESLVNDGLRAFMLKELADAGVRAVAPTLLPDWSKLESESLCMTSNWSERHAAYVCGLGTFGLCEGLITAAGKAMRAGSLVLRLQLPPTPRPYSDHREYCLYFNSGTCGKCIKRCPAGAVSGQGHDKILCSRHLSGPTTAYVRENYGFDGFGCGLCQVGVPCESGIPPKPAKAARAGSE